MRTSASSLVSFRLSQGGVLALLLGWCVLLVFVRVERTGSLRYGFLLWNLLLAVLPLGFSRALREAVRQRWAWPALGALGAAWLLFLPNAPYLLTDLVHLSYSPPVPLWYDLALLLSAAGTGVLLGYLSLRDVHALVAQARGSVAGWSVAMGALGLSGVGLYLGRVRRWNSWDVLARPDALLADVCRLLLDPLAFPGAAALILCFGGTLALGYVAFVAFTSDR